MALLTPRRSPRLISKRAREETITPTKSKLRKFLRVPEDGLLEKIERNIAMRFSDLNSEIVTYSTDCKLKRCLMVLRKIKEFDVTIGPFNAVRVVVDSDGCYKLYAFDRVIEEGVSILSSDCIVLCRVSDPDNVCCPGIPSYSFYLSVIGYKVKGACASSIPPDHVRDEKCQLLYKKNKKQQSDMCSECIRLKKHLNELTKAHTSISVSEKESRSNVSSKVPDLYLSPASKEFKMKKLKSEVKTLKNQKQKLLTSVKRYELEEMQRQDISDLIKAFKENESGKSMFDELCNEADKTMEGRGSILRAIWKQDTEDQEFFEDQVKNKTGSKGNKWSPITIRIALAIYSRSPSAYNALRSLGILQLPCTKIVRGQLHQSAKSPGINEDDLLKYAEKYEEYVLDRVKSGFAPPKSEGILIWDETKVESGLIWNSKNSSIVGYSVSSAELSHLHDVYEQLDVDENMMKTTYILQFLWRDLTSDFDLLGPYFSLSGNIESRFLHSIVTRTMLALHQFNFHVRALVCDGASSNLSLLKILCDFDAEQNANNRAWFTSPYDNEPVFLIICPSHQLKNMIAALYSSREHGSKSFQKKGVSFGWKAIEHVFEDDMKRAKSGLSRRVPGLKYSYVVRDSWTRLNVQPAKIMQQKYMISAIHELTTNDEIFGQSRMVTASYLEACNLLFEQGILSHSTITTSNHDVLENMKKGLLYFKEWHQELLEIDYDYRDPTQKMFLAWQTYDLLNIMYYGFTELCSFMIKKYPGYMMSPLRINGSAIESVFSSLKYIAGGHLASTNYSNTLASSLIKKETTVNPNIKEKGYRTIKLSL